VRELNGGQNGVKHDFHLELSEGHADTAASAPAERQILVRRVPTFQKSFGPKCVRIRVNLFSVMGEVNASDHDGSGIKRYARQVNAGFRDPGKRKHPDGTNPQRLGTNCVQIG